MGELIKCKFINAIQLGEKYKNKKNNLKLIKIKKYLKGHKNGIKKWKI